MNSIEEKYNKKFARHSDIFSEFLVHKDKTDFFWFKYIRGR